MSITSSGQLANSPSYGCPTPTQEKNEIVGMQIIRSSIMQTDVSSKTADIIMQSWSKGSIKQYSTSLRTWSVLCGKWNINSYDPPVTRVLDYLTSLFERGLSYDAINTAKSAISAITSPRNGVSLGCQPLISTFMKGIFKSRPPVPISKDTISRWIRTVMTDAGIYMNVFKPHSTRSTATSKALQSCVPIQGILKQAGWSNQRTINRFYNKPVFRSSGFAEAALDIQ